ncbi:MAG: DNA topoisomerase [Culicoidibacterales bacterium]
MAIVYFCEKPSQAQALATALSQKATKKEGYYDGNDGKLYTYAYGHLTTLVAPEVIHPDFSWKGDLTQFPFLVADIPLELSKQKGVAAQFKVIKSLFQQASRIVVATDAGREGEHIFRTVYQLARCQKPFTRLWLQDMTESGIRQADAQARPGSDYNGLALAGKLRAEADWLVGMNATIFAARTLQARISLGRVQTPTLKMLVQRHLEILNFHSRTYYNLIAPTTIEKVNFELQRDKQTVEFTKEEAEALRDLLQPVPITNWHISQQLQQEAPPKLFDLTELQKIANKQLNLTASDTLAIAQNLYEKKFITYPRTSSQYLASSEGLLTRVEALGGNEIITQGYTIHPFYINPKKVTDHEALIPTGKVPNSLPAREQQVFDLIRTRFFAAFYPYAKKQKVTAQFQKNEELFIANQTVIQELGWLKLYGKTEEVSELLTYQPENVQPLAIKEVVTQPKKPYNDSSLLADMKNAAKFINDDVTLAKILKTTDAQGIGTPATRAAIIEALIKRELIMRQGKQLHPTVKGIELIQALPEDFALCSPKMTAVWETLLAEVEAQTLSADAFYEQLYEGIRSLIVELKPLLPLTSTDHSQGSGKQKKGKTDRSNSMLCQCPKCGQPIYENEKSFSCSGYQSGCKVTIWKNGLEKLGKKTITKTEAKQLLQMKHPKVKLKSKAGKAYEAYAGWNPENNWITIQFDQHAFPQAQQQQKQKQGTQPKQHTPVKQTPPTRVVAVPQEQRNLQAETPSLAPQTAPKVRQAPPSGVEVDFGWGAIPDFSDIPLPPPPPEEE